MATHAIDKPGTPEGPCAEMHNYEGSDRFDRETINRRKRATLAWRDKLEQTLIDYGRGGEVEAARRKRQNRNSD